ncbi:MAG: STAS domain-containing protein [Anaerolineales bacterium]|nr:STAS domain-containing protein [Anaerolineales bacterium]
MDELSVKSEIRRNAAVVTISGRVDSVSAAALDEQLSKIAHENNRLALDLSDVTYLSSAGVRAIVKTLQSAEKSGGGVVLANVSDAVRRVLETVGMMQMLRVFPSVEEAVGSF